MQKQQDIATLRSIHARGNPHGGVNAAPLPVTGYPDMPVVILVFISNVFLEAGATTKAEAQAKVGAEAEALGAQCTLGATSLMPARQG